MSKLTVTALLVVSLLAGCTTPPPVGYQLRIVPPIQISEAERFRDGGSLRLQFTDETKHAVIVHMDFRYGGPRQGEVLWVPRGTNTAQKLVPGGDQEADLIAVLRQWVSANVPVETQAKVANQDRPGGTDQEYLAWLVTKMIRTLEVRSGKPAY
jgi:hypothetical protein